MSTKTTIRMSDDLKGDLTELAMRMDVSLNEMMEICLVNGLAVTRNAWYRMQRAQ